MIGHLLAASLYVISLVAYGLLRGEAFDVPGILVEVAILVIPSLLLGLVIGRWWALAAPVVADAILLAVWANAAEDPNRPDLIIFLVVITLPFMLLGTGVGVGTSQVTKHFGE